MRKPNKNKMAGVNSRFASVSESIFNGFLLKMLLRSLPVYILKQLFFSISVNSGRIFTSPLHGSVNILPLFTSISKNNCYIFGETAGEKFYADLNHSNFFRLRVVPLSLSPSCVTGTETASKMVLARARGGRDAWSSPTRVHATNFFSRFFLASRTTDQAKEGLLCNFFVDVAT